MDAGAITPISILGKITCQLPLGIERRWQPTQGIRSGTNARRRIHPVDASGRL
jgi:hypothetical protein